MLLLLVISLGISTPAQASAEGARDAPAYESTWLPPPVPEGLPEAEAAPRRGSWVRVDGSIEATGTWLPEELSRDVLLRLQLLERAPTLCAERLKWARERCAVDRMAAVDVALADAGAERVRIETKPQGWPTWQVALVAIGAAVLGGAIGFGAGVIAY